MHNLLTDAAATVPARDRRQLRREAEEGSRSQETMSKSQRGEQGAGGSAWGGHLDCDLLPLLKLSLVLGLRGQSCLQISPELEVWVRIG